VEHKNKHKPYYNMNATSWHKGYKCTGLEVVLKLNLGIKLSGIGYFIDTFTVAGIYQVCSLFCYKKMHNDGKRLYRLMEAIDSASKPAIDCNHYASCVFTAVNLSFGSAHFILSVWYR
jgi:hypothetical protein